MHAASCRNDHAMSWLLLALRILCTCVEVVLNGSMVYAGCAHCVTILQAVDGEANWCEPAWKVIVCVRLLAREAQTSGGTSIVLFMIVCVSFSGCHACRTLQQSGMHYLPPQHSLPS